MPSPTERKRRCEYFADLFVNLMIVVAVIAITVKTWELFHG